MLWILLALLGAVTNAAYFIIIKKYIAVLDPRLLTGLGFTGGGCLLFAFSALHGFPSHGPDFFPAVTITTILNILGLFLIFRALSASDLSLSVPLLSFTPVILIGTSSVLLKEMPSLSGVFGICIIVSGSYVLNIAAGYHHFLDPVRSMVQNRGSWYMLIVAFLFAVSINFDKVTLLNSDPFFGMALTVLSIGIAFLLVSAYSPIAGRRSPPDRSPHGPDQEDSPKRAFSPVHLTALSLLIGLCVAIEAASINIAYSLQIVAYVIALKRLSIIFMVLYGTIVFSEHEIAQRVMGAALMVSGAIIILLFA
jgi:drug/metabolite transporter (DMT)-like permease